jgi:hypothetical protein
MQPIGRTVAEAARTCDLKAASASAAEAALAGCDAKWIDANVAINQLQSMGTHNSYKEQIRIEMASSGSAAQTPPSRSIMRTAPSPSSSTRARQIELDPSDDPQGSLRHAARAQVAHRKRRDAAGLRSRRHVRPGIKVIHVSDIDYRSHCLLFTDCLKQIKAWSDASHAHADPDDDQSEILTSLARRCESPAVGQGSFRPHGRGNPLRLL